VLKFLVLGLMSVESPHPCQWNRGATGAVIGQWQVDFIKTGGCMTGKLKGKKAIIISGGMSGLEVFTRILLAAFRPRSNRPFSAAFSPFCDERARPAHHV
jgi:hypothetical protein